MEDTHGHGEAFVPHRVDLPQRRRGDQNMEAALEAADVSQGDDYIDSPAVEDESETDTDSLPDLVPSLDTSLATSDDYMPSSTPRIDSPAFSDITERSYYSEPVVLSASDRAAARRQRAALELESRTNEMDITRRKIRRSIQQIIHLDNFLCDTKIRYRRAVNNQNNRFADTLNHRITLVSSVRMMFYEYGMKQGTKMLQLRNNINALHVALDIDNSI